MIESGYIPNDPKIQESVKKKTKNLLEFILNTKWKEKETSMLGKLLLDEVQYNQEEEENKRIYLLDAFYHLMKLILLDSIT